MYYLLFERPFAYNYFPRLVLKKAKLSDDSLVAIKRARLYY